MKVHYLNLFLFLLFLSVIIIICAKLLDITSTISKDLLLLISSVTVLILIFKISQTKKA